MVGAAILLAIAASGPAPDAALPVSTVRVAPLRTVLTGPAEIGRRGVGWTCFPAGSVRWRDLSFDPDEAATTVAQALTAHGVAAEVVQAAGGVQGEAPILSGTIRAVSAKACSPQYGIGKVLAAGPRIKGRVSIAIDWTVRTGGGAVRSLTTQSEAKVSAKDAGYEALLTEGLVQAGGAAAAALKGKGEPAPPAGGS